MSEITQPIPARLKNVAVNGHVAGAADIIDDSLNRTQAVINAMIDEVLGDGGNVAFIDDDDPGQAVVPSFDPESQSVHITSQVLSEQQKAQVRTNIGLNDVDTRISNAVNGVESEMNTKFQQYDTAIGALNGSDVVVGALPLSGEVNKVYRVPNDPTTNKYTDYGWDGTQFVALATYPNDVDDEPTAGSENLVKSGGVFNKIGQLQQNIDGVFQDNESEKTSFIDANGNVALEVDNNGVKARKFIVCDENGNTVKTYDGNDMNIMPSDDGNFYFIDSYGNIAFKIGEDGIDAKVVGENLSLLLGGQSILKDKNVLMVGDSLCNRPSFADYFKELSGCNMFFNHLGGTTSFPYGSSVTPAGTKTSGQDRLLAAFKGKTIVASKPDTFIPYDYEGTDYIFLENVNDLLANYHLPNGLGTVNDAPFMVSQYVPITTQEVGINNAKEYIEDNFASVISSALSSLHEVGEIYIQTKPSSNGNITVSIGNATLTVSIATTDTKLDICRKIRDKINSEQGTDFKAVASGTHCYITSLDTMSAIPSVNVGTTSMVCTAGKYYKGTILDIGFVGSSYKIAIAGTANANGVVTVIIGNNSYPVSITAGMTSQEIASAIGQYSFEGFSHSVSGNNVILVRTEESLDVPTIDVGSTGCYGSVTAAGEGNHVFLYFYGGDSTDFTDISKWSWIPPSISATYKGMIEFIQITLPKCKIVCVFPTAYQTKFYDDILDQGNDVDEWGYLSWTDLRSRQWYFNTMLPLVNCVKQVAGYYFVDFADLFEESGVTLMNQDFFYPEDGGVHPLQTMHKRWAEVLFSKLK